MPRHLHIVLVAAALLSCSVFPVGAWSGSMRALNVAPNHDWTIRIGTYSFGLVEWPANTPYFVMGSYAPPDKVVRLHLGHWNIPFASKETPLFLAFSALALTTLTVVLIGRKRNTPNTETPLSGMPPTGANRV